MAHKPKQSPKPIVGDLAKRISKSGLAIDSQPVLKTSGAMGTNAVLSTTAIISTPTTASPSSLPTTLVTTALNLPPTGEGHSSSLPTQLPFFSTTLMSPLPLTQ